jgi:predicted TIM-barrel fold metal-dependent hydrolase
VGYSTYYPVHALGHPFGIAIQAAGMLAHGIFDKFPKIRVAFLEGGSTWVPFFLDRLDRSYHPGHLQVDIDDQRVGGPQEGEKASEYLRRQIREGGMFVGFDVDDDGLGGGPRCIYLRQRFSPRGFQRAEVPQRDR